MAEMSPKARVRRAARSIARWGEDSRLMTKLPWREGRTPYKVFLAEFLLTRTRADVVARVFNAILIRYPDVTSLAEADVTELEQLLRPLGLSKRVRLLVSAARHIREFHSGEIPMDQHDLEAIPGVGPYVAAAVRAFAFGRSTLPADVNVLRFIARVTGLPMSHPTRGSRELMDLTSELGLAHPSPRAETLIDFCRVICRPRNPQCLICPAVKCCLWGTATTSADARG